MDKKEYSVSEAVRLIGVESHVLRYWEEELQIAIRRTSQGHRVYSQENIEMFCQVKQLKEKGIQLKAIRVLLLDSESDLRPVETAKQEEYGEETDTYEVLTVDEKTDRMIRFEQILKNLLADMMEEEHQKMEQIIEERIRAELEDLRQQYEDIWYEAAAAANQERKGSKFWKKLLLFMGK